MTSPATARPSRPASPGSARRPTRRQSAPSVVQVEVAPAASTVPIVGADALELARDRARRLELLGRQVLRVRVVERADHPLDRALDERLAVDVAAGVAVGDRPVGVPERLERVGLVGGRARGQRGLAAERPAGDEQGAAGEDRDQGEGDEERAGPPTGRAVRRRGAGVSTGSWRDVAARVGVHRVGSVRPIGAGGRGHRMR